MRMSRDGLPCQVDVYRKSLQLCGLLTKAAFLRSVSPGGWGLETANVGVPHSRTSGTTSWLCILRHHIESGSCLR